MSTQPNNDFDLDAFLLEVEAESDEEKEVAKKLFSRKKNQGLVLRQSDYDKKMNAGKADLTAKEQKLADALREVEAKRTSLDDLITKNIAYKGEADKAVEKAQKEVEKAQAKAAKAAKAAGYDLDDEFDEDDLPTPKKPSFNEEEFLNKLKPQFVTPDVLDRLASGHINLVLELDEVNETYQDLRGKRMTKQQKSELLNEFGKQLQKDSTVKISSVAEVMFEFPKARNEREETARKKFEADIRADERAKVMKEASDQGLPAPRRGGPVSPFAMKTRKEGEKPTEGRGIKLALEALEKQRASAGA